MRAPDGDRLSEVCRAQIYGRDSELRLLKESLRAVRVEDDCNLSSAVDRKIPASQDQDEPNKAVPATSHRNKSNAHLSDSQSTTETMEPVKEIGRRFVFVSGKSGTGKTSLIRRAFQDEACLFCSGKFEKAGQPRPFSTLTMCLSELCRGMIRFAEDSSGNQDFYPTLIRSALDAEDEIEILARLVPNISDLMGNTCTATTHNHHQELKLSSMQSNDDLERLKFLLRNFLVAVSVRQRPVVMFWDDLQWVDLASFHVLRSLLNNTQLKHFIFVGSYRVDEVDEDHMVIKCINDLPQPIRITLPNLTVEDLVTILLVSLNVRVDETERIQTVRGLADLLHHRTDGNVFHFLEILDYLQAENLVYYDKLSFRWMWDLDRIQNQTNLSDNMVGIVIAKIQRLPCCVRDLLKFCGLLGFRLDEQLVVSVFPRLQQNDCDDDIPKTLGVLIKEGLLEAIHGRLKFVHDKVYQAATELQSNAEPCHLAIGREIKKEIDISSVDAEGAINNDFFVCVDQLNLGRALLSDKSEKIDLAKLNLVAARAASRMSAFIPAASYAESGWEQLDVKTRWTLCYPVALDLATLMAEMYSITGDLEKLSMISDEVVCHGKGINDKIRTYVALTAAPVLENNLERKYAMAATVLKELGAAIPAKPSKKYVSRTFAKLKRDLAVLSDEEITAFPRMTDAHKIGAMRMMGSMITEQMIAATPNAIYLEVIVSSMVILTLEHGLCADSVVGFSLLGARVATVGHIQLAQRFAKLARKLLDVPAIEGIGTARPKVLLGSVMVLHWSESLSSLTDQALSSFENGMRYGDTTSGFSVSCYLQFISWFIRALLLPVCLRLL